MSENHDEGAEKSASYTHIIALNYFSFLFLTGGGFGCILLTDNMVGAVTYFALWLYLLPPLLCRITLFFTGRPTGQVTTDSNTHTLWWWLFQLQLPFNRFPFIEELLRCVPGLYALWLNLWGGEVSLFAFWSPGVAVMERYHLKIEKGVILGSQAFLSGHLITKQTDGSTLLWVDKIQLDEGALVGARANIGPGCHIHKHQTVPFNAVLRSYTEIKDGRKIFKQRSLLQNP